MSSKPKDNAQKASSEPNRLPFEPAKSRKKAEKKAVAPVAESKSARPLKTSPAGDRNAASTAIPDVVSRRMVRRMALLCGIPSALGISTFVVSYLAVSNDLFLLPNVAVVLVSMGFFGLGVLGLSYGVLSASWDEDRVGSRVGWSEFTTNLGRMTAAWRSAKKS